MGQDYIWYCQSGSLREASDDKLTLAIKSLSCYSALKAKDLINLQTNQRQKIEKTIKGMLTGISCFAPELVIHQWRWINKLNEYSKSEKGK